MPSREATEAYDTCQAPGLRPDIIRVGASG